MLTGPASGPVDPVSAMVTTKARSAHSAGGRECSGETRGRSAAASHEGNEAGVGTALIG